MDFTEGQKLFKVLAAVDTPEDMQKLLEDLCTINEIQSMAQRLTVAEQLWNKRNYQEVAEDTGASSATISRVNRCLRYGAGGYRMVLQKGKNDGAR